MSSGGATTTTINNPTATANSGVVPVTHHRRRIGDSMADSYSSDNNKNLDHVQIGFDHSSNYHHDDDDDQQCNCNNGGHRHRQSAHHPFIRYLLVLKNVPENWVFGIEEIFLNFSDVLHSLRSRKNMGRTLFGLLMMLVVVSVFLKVSLMTNGGQLEVLGNRGRGNNGFLISTIRNVKNDWNKAQNVLADSERIFKRQMTEFPVSPGTNFPDEIFFFISCPPPRFDFFEN